MKDIRKEFISSNGSGTVIQFILPIPLLRIFAKTKDHRSRINLGKQEEKIMNRK